MCLWISYAFQNKQHITLKIITLLVFVMQTGFVPAREAPRIRNKVITPSDVPAVGNGKTNGRKPKRLMRGRAVAFLAVMSDMWLEIWSWTSADRQTDRQTASWKVTCWTTVIPSLEFFISLIFTGQTNLIIEWRQSMVRWDRSISHLTRYHYLVHLWHFLRRVITENNPSLLPSVDNSCQ